MNFQSKRVADLETSIPLFYASPRNILQVANGLDIRTGR